MASEVQPLGYRGYIASRPFMGERAQQQVQNIIIMNYAQRENLHYLLSATEYAMADCTMILDQLLDELPQLQGVICYSLFLLPEQAERRRKVYDAVLAAGSEMHFAVERLVLRDAEDAARIEAIWLMRRALPLCPRELPAWN
jgi:sporadic carbohydrate cluster protein (TIGR04323 family)